MNKPRVVFLVSSAGAYGGENALLDLARGIQKEFEPIVVAPGEGPLLDSLSAYGAQTTVFSFPVLDKKYFHPARIFQYLTSAIPSIFRLRKLFKELRPDVVHTNNVLILSGAFAAKMLGIPHVWHIREVIQGHHIHPFLWRIWRWLILTFSTRVICISSAVQDQFEPSEKVIVIHDGVDTDIFHPLKRKNSGSARRRKDLLIGTVGRLEHRRKGQDIFIEAARVALKSRKDLRFIIVGHEREEIEEKERALHDLVTKYGLKQKIEFRGFVPRESMPELINELDVLVLCSKQPEGLGIVLLEAMACGKPVVSFSEGGPLDIVKDHQNGLLTKPQDAQDLAKAILELEENPKLRKALGSEGRKSVEKYFRNDLAAKKVGDVYEQILGTVKQR
jgi:glycosyltransferase involved in cell wall biosynthesis